MTCLAVSAVTCPAQTTLDVADRAFGQQEWKAAAAAYRTATAADEDNSRAWYQLGSCLLHLKRWDDAITALKNAARDDQWRANATYNIACAESRSDRGEAALTSLRRAIEAGFRNRQHLLRDPDLEIARHTPGFDEIRELLGEPTAMRLPKVAGHSDQFDSWLGEWDTRTLTRDANTGQWREAGRLHMQIIEAMAGQVVLEFARGQIVTGQGKTLGFSARAYDPAHQEWNLLLLWPSPSVAHFSPMAGSFRHGRGEFFVTWPRPNQVDGMMRYSFSDIHDNRLRWDSSRSSDGGNTWATSMIFEFARRGQDSEPLRADRNEDHSYGAGEDSRMLDFMLGSWQGKRALKGSKRMGISRKTTVHLEGALLMTEETQNHKDGTSFTAMEFAAFDAPGKRWVRFTIDQNRPRFQRWTGTAGRNEITWTASTPDGNVRESARRTNRGDGTPGLELASETRRDNGRWRKQWSAKLRNP